MTTSPNRLAANRANAEQSTGPRTPAGKAASSRNATRHGLLSRQPLLAGEDPAEYEALAVSLVEELAPAPGVEELLLDDIVSLVWRLRRLVRVEAALYTVELSGPVLRALDEAGDATTALGLAFAGQALSFATLNRYETALVQRLRRALLDLERLQTERRMSALVEVPIHPVANGFVPQRVPSTTAPRRLTGGSLEPPEAPLDRFRERQLPEAIEKGGRR